MFTISLDGIRLSPEDHTSFNDATITVRVKDENGNTSTSFSGDVSFRYFGYSYLKERLIDNPDAYNTNVSVLIYNDCCEDKVVFQGIIHAKSIDWCDGDCVINATIVEDNETSRKLSCLQETYVWDNFDGFQNRNHPFVKHCTEIRPSSLGDTIMWLALTTSFGVLGFVLPIVVALTPIIVLLNAIEDFLCTLSGGSFCPDNIPSNTFLIDEMMNMLQGINKSIIGCGKGHAAPLVRDYLENGCKKCGLRFQSSILTSPNSPYYNTLWFTAPVDEGTFDYKNWTDQNKPLYTVDEMLKRLKLVFYAETKVIGNTLLFEPENYFVNDDVWIDLTDDQIQHSNVCYKYPSKPDPAGLQIRYLEDTTDWVGNEARHLYEEIIDWKALQNNPRLRGIQKVVLEFGTSRFRRDNIDKDVISEWQSAFDIVGFDIIPADLDHVLLLPADLCSTDRLLIWDAQNSPYTNAKVVKQPIPNTTNKFYFNKDYFMSTPFNVQLATEPPYAHVQGNLYDRFWYQASPFIKNKKGYDFSVSVPISCEFLNTMKATSLVRLPDGSLGSIKEITISEREIQIKGTV